MDMRKTPVILAIALAAALLHFGAMAGFEALGVFEGSHGAHASEAMPLMPSCPVGYVCPVPPTPFAPAAAMLLLLAAVIPVLAARFADALLVLRPSAAGPPLRAPDDPKTLLSVFKRE